ncbi:MAG: MFS transporter [Chloroflexi bacterium]|nr:MFS transporter [Chloroflexota bacterium]
MTFLRRNPIILALCLGHFTVDLYANLLPMAFPQVKSAMGLSYAQVGFLATTYIVASSLMQPFFGYLGDRFGSRRLASAGILWIAAFMALIGFSWSYLSLLAFIALASLGSAAFHPQGAMNVALASKERKVLSMSIFVLGGTFGFALSPLIGAGIISAFGLKGIMAMLPLPLAVAPFIYWVLSRIDARQPEDSRGVGRGRPGRLPLVGLLSVVTLVMIRSWTVMGMNSYIPLLYRGRGLSTVLASETLFVFLASGSVGMLLGGYLADQSGRRKVIFASLFFLTPVALFFMEASPAWALVAIGLLGIGLEASVPVTLVMAQEMLPTSTGLASGLMMGFTFVAGGIGISITGWLADQFGLPAALSMLAYLPPVAALFTLGLPGTVKRGATVVQEFNS